jgi:hypothetical protein
MIRLYIDFEVTEALHGHIINWVIGWLYDRGYAFSYQKYDYRGSWSVDIHAKGLEPVGDIFEFALDFGDDLRHFAYEIDAVDVVIGVCSNEECVDIWFEDLKKLEEQMFEEIEKRWEEIMNAMWDEINYDTCIRAEGL